jgi:Uma2 family endonuclease
MALSAIQDKRYSYQDYQGWSDEQRWEIIDGIPISMSPAPLIRHQRIAGNLFYLLKKKIDKRCPVFDAPTDVVFDDYNVVQPDVFVVCDKSKITEADIQGAPDLIIEVISSGTSLNDRKVKKKLYERFGVKEYLIVFPKNDTVERYVLRNGRYGFPEIFKGYEILPLMVFDIEINLAEIFER